MVENASRVLVYGIENVSSALQKQLRILRTLTADKKQ